MGTDQSHGNISKDTMETSGPPAETMPSAPNGPPHTLKKTMAISAPVPITRFVDPWLPVLLDLRCRGGGLQPSPLVSAPRKSRSLPASRPR